MIHAIIKSADDAHIGTINKENNGFRISWKERMENKPGNIHSLGKELYPTFEEARQEVFRAVRDAKIIEEK